MDFNNYYLNQANGLPVFRGSLYQRGYGLGNAFRRFISWAIPILKEYGLPVVKSVGKEIITNVASIANDAIEGKDINESVKDKFKTSLEKIQKGRGIKRRKQIKPKRKQKSRKLDIFD